MGAVPTNDVVGGSIVRLTDDGAWTWFNDPRAVCDRGRLFTGWVNRARDVQVACHELASQRTQILTLHAAFQADDHVNPAILNNRDGSLTAFYTKHGGERVWQRS